MTRPKTPPPIHKPVFDEESVLRFAGRDRQKNAGSLPGGSEEKPVAATKKERGGKVPGAERIAVTLKLKQEVLAFLKEEAVRKEKRIDQIVEKLVMKHLGKH